MHGIISRLLPILIAASLAAMSAVPCALAAEEESLEDAILKEKCGLCHSSKRLLTMDPAQLKPVLERMQKKNPDWITEIEGDHIARVLANVLGKTEIITVRKGWMEAVERGERLFGDESIGTNGKACTDCHTRETMRQVADGYPQYDLTLGRVVSLEERVSLMFAGQLEGKKEGMADQRLIDIIAYIKSLY
ncbi:hypothetical protein ACFL2P_01080 [Candidatus Moduliflexota bacterium]